MRRASPWLLATGLATLVNPWGWSIYHGLLVEQRAYAQGQLWINEWAPVRINWANISRSFLFRQTTSHNLSVARHLPWWQPRRRRYADTGRRPSCCWEQCIRRFMPSAWERLFACVLVIAGGPELAWVLTGLGRRIRTPRTRWLVAGAAVACLALLAGVRSFDLITNRHYYSSADEAVFGAGLCSWFPERAAEFIVQQKLPGEILNTYAAGGFLAWRLGPERGVYIDGRDTLYGPPRLARQSELMFGSPDSVIWQDEANRYNINTVVIALARYDGLKPDLLRGLCNSTVWRPVYLDEKSAVFVRQSPENAEVIQRFPVDCATAPLPALPPLGEKSAEAFNAWTIAAITLAALGRNPEALNAYQKALAIFPDSAFLHRNYADLLFAMGRMDDSEQEYLLAIKLEPSADTWGASGAFLSTARPHARWRGSHGTRGSILAAAVPDAG